MDEVKSNAAVPAAARAPASVDILALTLLDVHGMSESELMALRMRLYQTADVHDVDALKQRMVEFVHLHHAQAQCFRIMTLNRRFGRVAKKLGTSVLNMLMELGSIGVLSEVEKHGVRIILSTSLYKTQQEQWVHEEINPSDVLQRLCDSSQ